MIASLRRAGRFLAWALALGAELLSLPAMASTPGLLPRHPRVAEAQLTVPTPRVIATPGLASPASRADDGGSGVGAAAEAFGSVAAGGPIVEREASDASDASDASVESVARMGSDINGPDRSVDAGNTGAARDSEARPFDTLVRRVARTASLEAALLHAIIETESGYDPQAVSPRGAIGLMQVLPHTGARFGVRRLEDPAENLRAGAAYLQWLLSRFDGELPLALAAYNAGEGAVLRYGRRIPPFPETQNYVRKVMAGYSRLLDASALRGRGRRDDAARPEPSYRREPQGATAVAGGASITSASSERGLSEVRGGVAVQEMRSAEPSTRAIADAAVGDTWRLLRGLGELMTRSPSAQADSRDRPAVVMPPR